MARRLRIPASERRIKTVREKHAEAELRRLKRGCKKYLRALNHAFRSRIGEAITNVAQPWSGVIAAFSDEMRMCEVQRLREKGFLIP